MSDDESSHDLLALASQAQASGASTVPLTQRTSATGSVWLSASAAIPTAAIASPASPQPGDRASLSHASSMAEDAAVLASLSALPTPQRSRQLPDWLRDKSAELHELAAQSYRALAEERHALRESFTQELAADGDDAEAPVDDRVTLQLSRLAPLTQPSGGGVPATPAAVVLPIGGRVICFDIETTGFAQEDCIIEIGACELIDGQPTGLLFQSYAVPTVPIHPAAEAVHGLSLARLAHEPPLSAVLASFVEFAGDSPLVAHNMAFDRRFVARALERRGSALANPTFCTMQAYRRAHPGQRFSLDGAVTHLALLRGVQRVAHSALDDARAVAALYAHLTGQDRAKRGEFGSLQANHSTTPGQQR